MIWSVIIFETDCVYFAVGAGSLYILRVNTEVLNSSHLALRNVSNKFADACRVKFTAILKHEDANTYGEMGRTFPAFSFPEIEGSQ